MQMPTQQLGWSQYQQAHAASQFAGEIQSRMPEVPASLAEKLAFANTEAGEYAKFAEIHRVCELPVRFAMTPEEIELFNQQHVLAHAYADRQDPFRLWPIQAEGVSAFLNTGGLVGSIGVGWGKTLICIMIASLGFSAGHRKMVYMLPSSVFGQFWKIDLRWARQRVPVSMPVIPLVGRSMRDRKLIARQDRPGLYVLSWELVSREDGEEILKYIAPTLVIGDEAQNIRNHSSARTKRFERYVSAARPRCAFVSGTITSKSPQDYHHLMSWALGHGSCLPLPPRLASEWYPVIDSSADTTEGYSPVSQSSNRGAIMPLIEWARRTFPQWDRYLTETTAGFRLAFKLRFSTTPGVVSSGDREIGVSLRISNREIQDYQNAPGWEELAELMRQVDEDWLTPNDDPIEFVIHKWKWLYELSHGFWNRLYWADYQTVARRRNITDHEAYDIICRSMEQHAALNEYHKVLRDFIENHSREGLDTPFKIGNVMRLSGAEHVTEELFDAWNFAKSLEFEGMIERDREAIRVCSFKIDDTIKWVQESAKKRGKYGCILWYYHHGLGNWLSEKATEAGLDVLHCPAGPKGNEDIRDESNASKVVVASWKAHGVGKNLQHFRHQYVVQWPRNGADAEQLLGRTHRNGQTADEIVVHTGQTLSFDCMQFSACALDALYTHQTTGNRQKMVYANYGPMPRMFPPGVLIEKGMDVRPLNTQQSSMFTEKFLVD